MNHLRNAASKYLLQHAHNPVDWYPWGEEPFAVARKGNKPVLVSIGYAACHWCHVMERESFEDMEVAAFMNKEFVCIKVDREEHPDVDHFYMDALQSLSGSGGWPLNMFVTPEKKPFYGGTYFPPKPMQGRNSWMGLLQAVAKAWKEQPDDIAQQTAQMMHHLRQVALASTNQSLNLSGLNRELVDGICRNLLAHADTAWGGFGGAPKFPAGCAVRFLLDFYQLQQNGECVNNLGERALKQATLTLDKMLSGGIYDQVGGGFFRYATDNYWQTPHYEKMLYDNAAMISVLSVACRVTGKKHYKRALKETVAFCNRELKHPDCPGFYCSLDADTNGVEGGYYLWTAEEWQAAVPHAHPALAHYFGMEGAEGSSAEPHPLWCIRSEEDICTEFELTAQDWDRILEEGKRALLQYRSRRERPETDDKMLLSWNSLMNKALQDAAVALSDETYMQQAGQHLQWMRRSFHHAEEGWQHVYKEGATYVAAKLDDYAFLIRAMLGYSGYTGQQEYLTAASTCAKEVMLLFRSEGSPYFYYSSEKQQDIPLRKVDIYDGAQPSANAVMAENLFLLGECYGMQAWTEQSLRMLAGVGITVNRYARSFACWGVFIQLVVAKPKQLVLSGSHVLAMLNQWAESYFPEVFAWACTQPTDESIPLLSNKYSKEVQQRLYLCSHGQCLQPVMRVEEIRSLIKKSR